MILSRHAGLLGPFGDRGASSTAVLTEVQVLVEELAVGLQRGRETILTIATFNRSKIYCFETTGVTGHAEQLFLCLARGERETEMMMTLISSCRNNNQPAAVYG